MTTMEKVTYWLNHPLAWFCYVWFAIIAFTMFTVYLSRWNRQGRFDTWHKLGWSYEERLYDFFARFHPAKVENDENFVPRMVRKYGRQMDRFFDKLRDKYNATYREL